ncbi:MAG TPA: tetratricopeptide repeat protein [Micropepsaceae bacterium]|nr:tetratricopeptide repeat protein [Micropepsaceae bacterium]
MEIAEGAAETQEKFAANEGAAAKEGALLRAEQQTHQRGVDTPARAASNRILARAIRAYRKNNFKKTALLALDATQADETNAHAFHVLALGLENLGQLYKALQMYERAWRLGGDDCDLFINLGLVAWRLGMLPAAETFFRRVMALNPLYVMAWNNLAGILRDAGRYAEAIDIVRDAISRHPEESHLWNTVGTIMIEQAEWAQGETFLAEAVRLDAKNGRAFHNLGNALTHLSRFDDAISAFDAACVHAASPRDRAETVMARSLCLMSMGRVAEGFDAYEGRHSRLTRGSSFYGVTGNVWKGESLAGRRVGIICEQGLGDEIMFAEVIPDVLEAIGENGTLMIASERRLVPLFQRSFPKAKCGAYHLTQSNGKAIRNAQWMNADGPLDVFFPCGDALRYMRRDLSAFSGRAFLTPDPSRAAAYREQLAAFGPGPKIGICWRSMLTSGQRRKYFRNIDAWEKLLSVPGATFINLQYGDCADELTHAREKLGVVIHEMPGLDLKHDLDGAAALSSVLDLAVAAPTAAAALAAATGTETWFVAMGRVWPQLGTENYPWYRATRVFAPQRFGDWDEAMDAASAALADFTQRMALAA